MMFTRLSPRPNPRDPTSSPSVMRETFDASNAVTELSSQAPPNSSWCPGYSAPASGTLLSGRTPALNMLRRGVRVKGLTLTGVPLEMCRAVWTIAGIASDDLMIASSRRSWICGLSEKFTRSAPHTRAFNGLRFSSAR